MAQPRAHNDVPASDLAIVTALDSVTITDRYVSAPSGYANRRGWRVSADGAFPLALGTSRLGT